VSTPLELGSLLSVDRKHLNFEEEPAARRNAPGWKPTRAVALVRRDIKPAKSEEKKEPS
jgi:hypothetical protein